MINAQDLLPMHKFYLLLKLIQLDEVIKIIKQKYPHISIENENSRDSNNVIQFRNMLERQLGFQIGDLEGKALIDFILEEFKFDSSRKMAKELYLNWNDVIKMKNSGMLIGSHTCSHRVLGKLGIQEQKYEILESKKILERHLHDQIDFFAYPFGYQESFNDKTKEILSKNNFSCAFAGVGRVDRKKGFDRYEIPRFLVKDSPIWEFSFEIWRYGWRNPWNIKN